MIITSRYEMPRGRYITVHLRYREAYAPGGQIPITALSKVTYEIPPEWVGDEEVEKEMAYLLSRNKPSTTGEGK